MRYKVPVFFLLWAMSFTAAAQTFMVLEKMGTKKRFEFYKGEIVLVKLDNDDYYTPLQIVDFGDSTLITEAEEIHLRSIKAINLNKKGGFLRYSGPLLMLAGAGLFAIDAINQSVVQGGSYTVSSGVTTASVILIGTGALFTFAKRDKVKLKKWWRLRIVRI